MNFSNIVKSALTLFVIVAIFGAAAFGLNFYTAPIIEQNNAGAALAPLLAVMPEGSSFGADAMIYDAENPSASTLKNVPENVLSIYKESAGKGFAFRLKASTQYSKEPMEITVGVTPDGKICGIQCDVYTESKDFGADFVKAFLGKDSALADVNIVAGVTYSSVAFKDAVSAGLGALISNQLIAEGVKSDAQILSEMIPTVHPGMASAGTLKAEEITPAGNIVSGYKAENNAGFAYIMTEGEASYLAVCNALGAVRVYNVEGADVTAEKSALADEAKAHALANQTSYVDAAKTKFAQMMAGATDMQELTVDFFGTVVAAVEFKVEDATYYGFYARPFGFETMDVYVVIDENGAIAKMTAKTFIFEEEYFNAFGGMNVESYVGGFVGLTDQWDGSAALIATATMSTNAVKQATNDAFAAFKAMQNGGADE